MTNNYKKRVTAYLAINNLLVVIAIIAVVNLYTGTEFTSELKDNHVYTAYHLFKKDKAITEEGNEVVDVIKLKASDVLSMENIDKVYLPSIGTVNVLKYTEDYIIIDAINYARSGLSGTRVLTADMLFDLGFISRIDNGEVYVVRTLKF